MLSASSVLHYWSARYGSVPVVGGKPTHSRSSAAAWIDQQGVLQSAIVNTPRMGWATIAGERRQVMKLEAARTNGVLWSSDFSNSAWTKTNVTVTTGIADPTGGTGACTLTATTNAATIQQLLAVGSSIVRTNSFWIRRRTGVGNIDIIKPDFSAWVIQPITSQWQRFFAVGPVSTARDIAMQIEISGDAVDVFVGQQDDSPAMSSEIATMSAAVTRAADSFNWAYAPLPQAMMIYTRFVERGTAGIGGGLFMIGSASLPTFGGYYSTGSSGYGGFFDNGSSAQFAIVAGVPSIGDTVELVYVLQSNGQMAVYVSINGGAVSSASLTPALSLPAAWASAQLTLNLENFQTGLVGLNDFAEFKIVKFADVVGVTAAAIMAELRAFELGPNGAVL